MAVVGDVMLSNGPPFIRADRFCYINLEAVWIASQGLVESDENVVATVPSDAAVNCGDSDGKAGRGCTLVSSPVLPSPDA